MLFKLDETTYANILEKITEHYAPKPSAIVQRFKFHTRERQPGESIPVYIAALRAIAEHCAFGDTLADMIRDRLVCGVNDKNIQRRLLQEADLTYKTAHDIAIAMESAAKNIYDLGGLKPTITSQSQIQHINRQTAPSAQRQKHTGSNPPSHHDRHNNHTVDRRPTITCHRCGLPGHLAPDCKFKDRVCHTCGKKGHLAKVCRSRNRSKTSHDQQQGESNLHSLHNATPDSVSSSPDEATVP